jgi:GT2 family glycosyltransferase
MAMRLSIVILCWNDRKVIGDCLRSIYAETQLESYEVIVSDNGSNDGSIEFIKAEHPQVHIIENGRNLRFAKANNVGIRACHGEYILILNPDTIIHEGTLDRIVKFADQHLEAAAFGCRVLNADGSYQVSARPFSTIRRELIVAFRLQWLAYLSDFLLGDSYQGWKGETEKRVDWITGCFMLIRSDLLRRLGGFDEQFFYYYEDMDLSRRIWKSGHSIVYTPVGTITHLKGHSTSQRLPPVTFAVDSQITRYLYYYKYYGKRGVRHARLVSLVSITVRRAGYGLLQLIQPTDLRKCRLDLLKALFQWNYRVDPVRLVENGEEPKLDFALTGRVLER